MDFDSYQRYFYDYDCGKDFYRSTESSEDIWKKFELVPPRRRPEAWDLAPGIGLLDLWPAEGAGDKAESRGHWEGCGRNYVPIVRGDCMWSGFSARERLERVVSDRLAAGAPQGNPSKTPADRGCAPNLEAGNPVHAAPCPLGEPKTQACSRSEIPSDSEGEEIDVVTVEKRQPVFTTVQADPSDPCVKHFYVSIHQQQHICAALFSLRKLLQEGVPEREPQEEALERDAPEEEEEEEIVRPPPVEREATQPCHPKPVSSDAEDVTKRKNQTSWSAKQFMALRDQVPPLASCSEAPKVVILSKTLEYLQTLLGTEMRIAT
uniref:Transcription regulator Myc N-terminal domain-containing protein n=1 Tax=Loxodonta africana TaxID=9785 RepID=G3UH59_LOXAF